MDDTTKMKTRRGCDCADDPTTMLPTMTPTTLNAAVMANGNGRGNDEIAALPQQLRLHR